MPTEGLYGLYHIIYIFLSYSLIAFGLVLTTLHPMRDNTRFWFLKILGGILLTLLVINRITVIKWYVDNNSGYRWIHVIPNTWCSAATLVLSLSLLISKKENIFYHFCVYLNIYGGIFTTLLPTYLNDQGFFEIRTFSSLLYHSLAFFVALFLFLQKYIHPSFRKSLAFPIGMAIIMLIGYFQKFVMRYPLAMQVKEPFVDHGPYHFITAWYVVVPAGSLLVVFLNYCYEKFVLKRTNEAIFRLKNKTGDIDGVID